MKVKDLERTANVAWSPKNQHPIHLAAGTAAQQLDASFNTNAALELYSLNLTDPGPDMQLVSSVPSDHRFHKIVWGSHGSGTIIGGCDSGLVQIYDASKLMKGEEALVGKQEKHSGSVHALDFNSFQQNLFATGSSNSEIFIWDLNNTTTPMSPGAKSQPLEDVLSISWNKQVQHILASTFPSKCVIWDLRKNEPIIKLTDTVSRVRWKVVDWHPEVATQLCLASEEDHSPIIQLWDLRFATSPLKTLENHQRGVLSIAWCRDDPDLLISCGKDNRIVVWNPNSNQQNGEVLSELATTNQWSFDVVWCPRNPALIASPNFDGHVGVFSLMGGKIQQIQTSNKIADSFPGMDGYVQAPAPQVTPSISVDLTKPPKWMKKPVGASFGFGGKLITFENDKAAIAQAVQNAQTGQAAPPIYRTVQVSQVVTESELVQKSKELEKALEYGNFIEYCSNKADETTEQHKKYIWHFLKAIFDENPRAKMLNLLGYSLEDVNNKLNLHVGEELKNNVDELIDDLTANRLDDFAANDPFRTIGQPQGDDKPGDPLKIQTGDDTEGLITQALLINNVEAAVELCLKAKRYADALIIATTGGADLLARTQLRYLEQADGYVSSLISAMVSEDWGAIINNCDVASWKEALAAALTHASDDDLPILCERLGNRLEQHIHEDPKLGEEAQLCYLSAGSFEKLVSTWTDGATTSTSGLQELVELVMFMQKAFERKNGQVQVTGALADLLSNYASLLASQGELGTALAYLCPSQDEKLTALRDRLHIALGMLPSYIAESKQGRSRKSSQRQSFSNYPNTVNNTNPFGGPNQFVPPQPSGVPQFNPSQFNTGLPNPVANTQPWQAQPINSYSQPPQTFSPAPQLPPATQPPRPTSVGSSHGGGLPSRKYLLDPSVASNPYGSPRNMYTAEPRPFQNGAAPYVPPPLNHAPLSPSSFNTPPNPAYNPVPPIPAFEPANVAPSQYGAAPPIENAQQALNFTANAPSGWNDPPPVSRPLKNEPKPEVSAVNPITHPIFGSAPEQQPDAYGPPSQPYNGYAPPTAYQQAPPVAAYQPVAPQSTFNAAHFQQNAVIRTTEQPMGVAKPETPQPIQKAAIPEEHIHLKTVLDELKDRCGCAANNPQTKRKLDDVGRKLETLYDLLRDHKLSPNTLASLHQLVQLIQNGDYTGGLNLHTQLVSGSDFAQIASFMPGLKVLLQCALQLQVYLR